jgi:hypothetical protein
VEEDPVGFGLEGERGGGLGREPEGRILVLRAEEERGERERR